MEEQQHILKQDGGKIVKVEAVKTSSGTQSSTPWRKLTAIDLVQDVAEAHTHVSNVQQRTQLATSANGKGTIAQCFSKSVAEISSEELESCEDPAFLDIVSGKQGESWRAKGAPVWKGN